MPFAISILIGYKTKFMAGIYIILGKYLQSILYFWYLIDWFATNERAPSTSYQLKTPHGKRSQDPICPAHLPSQVQIDEKTKKAFVNNLYINPFWWYMRHRDYDLIKFDFFQNLSSIGGFMQLLIYGGGKLSIDGRIKNE